MQERAATNGSVEVPAIISVDDHVIEPPDLWTSRLPATFLDRGPRVVRERGHTDGFIERSWQPADDGVWADVWYYDDHVVPLTAPYAAAGTEAESRQWNAITYDDIRPGCWQQDARLRDMDTNHTEASACFPNFFTRFCGQTFAERADKELALLCLQTYNDWMLDEWCAGDGAGRLIPITIVPLWDPALAAAEVRRCAAKGGHAISFTEMPSLLGLPTWYSGHWDPLFAACDETETTVGMHIGSAGFAITSVDAPQAAQAAITFQYGMYSVVDCILSGLFDRFPRVKVMYSEGNVGWLPYVLERLDMIQSTRGEGMTGGVRLARKPSEYIADRVYGCIVDDHIGLAMRDHIGMGQLCYETDYPHMASLWPDNRSVAARLAGDAGLSADETYQFVRGNAIRAFGLERFGINR